MIYYSAKYFTALNYLVKTPNKCRYEKGNFKHG